MSPAITSEMESKYHSKLIGDSLLIVGMLVLLVGVELFVISTILAVTWELSSAFSTIYVFFVGLLVTVEAVGCVRVRDSIKRHMFEFKYYD